MQFEFRWKISPSLPFFWSNLFDYFLNILWYFWPFFRPFSPISMKEEPRFKLNSIRCSILALLKPEVQFVWFLLISSLILFLLIYIWNYYIKCKDEDLDPLLLKLEQKIFQHQQQKLVNRQWSNTLREEILADAERL